MNIFKLEDYLSKYEFIAPYLLCCSDAESFSMQEILALASPSEKNLWDNLQLGYTESPGLPILRQTIAENFYPGLQADNILCTAGAEDGIFCALNVLCQTEDHVVLLTPCYQSLAEIPRAKGSQVTLIELQEQNQWRVDVTEVKRAITSKTTGIIINFPHNPTGQVIEKSEMDDLIALCASYNLWIFSDEVYRLLGTPKNGWAAPACELYPKALSLGVMSKSFGLAGLRIGWLASQDKALLKKIEHMKHYTSICNSAPAEILSTIALKMKDKLLARNNQIVAKNLALLDKFMQEYQNIFEWIKPQGGCVGFVKYKGAESIDNFAQNLVKETGVLLLPASVYDYPSNHFRIGFGRKNMPEALERLKQYLG